MAYLKTLAFLTLLFVASAHVICGAFGFAMPGLGL